MIKTFKITGTIVFTFFFLFMTSCAGIRELQIGEVKNIQMKGMNNNEITLQMTVAIQNPNAFRLKVKNSDIKVSVSGNEIGRIKQMDNLVISANSMKEYDIRVVVEITNFLAGLSSISKIMKGNDADIRLSGKLKVQSFLYFKTIDIEDYKLTQ